MLEEMLQGLQQTRRTLRWMAQGLVPSYELIQSAERVLEQAGSIGLTIDLSAARTLAWARQGILPTQEACLDADRQVHVIMQRLAQMDFSAEPDHASLAPSPS